MISAPTCQGAAPSRLCVMQDMAVLHRAVRSLHLDLSTNSHPPLERSVSLSHCFAHTSSQLNQVSPARQIMRRAFCAALGASKRPSPSPSIGRLCIRALEDSAVPCPKDVDILNTKRHVSSRTRAVAWHPGLQPAGLLQLASQGFSWLLFVSGFAKKINGQRHFSLKSPRALTPKNSRTVLADVLLSRHRD